MPAFKLYTKQLFKDVYIFSMYLQNKYYMLLQLQAGDIG
jgi:hypothetical protein